MTAIHDNPTTTPVTIDPRWGYLRIDPIPTVAEVDRYYAEEFYARADTAYENDSSLANMTEEADYHRRAYGDLLRLIEKATGPVAGRRLADVGCGYGHWMKFAAEHGVDVWGVEPVAEGVDHCREEGLAAYVRSVEELAEPPGGRVDIVSMVNVLEHLRDPAAVLDSLAENWLTPGGVVVLRVPNDFNDLQVVADEAHGLDRWWVVPPRHINYFSHESLARLLEATGFEILANTSTFPLELFLLMGDVYVGDPALGRACHRRRVTFERTLEERGRTDVRDRMYQALADAGLGREIVTVARRR